MSDNFRPGDAIVIEADYCVTYFHQYDDAGRKYTIYTDNDISNFHSGTESVTTYSVSENKYDTANNKYITLYPDALKKRERIWLFYCNLGRDVEHWTQGNTRTPLFIWFENNMKLKQTLLFKNGPRRDYYKGAVFLFEPE
ncbi:MAG: hypothetical protein WCX65_14100 [bacterium]